MSHGYLTSTHPLHCLQDPTSFLPRGSLGMKEEEEPEGRPSNPEQGRAPFWDPSSLWGGSGVYLTGYIRWLLSEQTS